MKRAKGEEVEVIDEKIAGLVKKVRTNWCSIRYFKEKL